MSIDDQHETEMPEDETGFVSKSELKRLAKLATELGKQLVELDRTTLGKFELPDRIRENIIATQSIKSNIARKRQLQFLGKLIRNHDAEESIQQQLSRLNRQHREDTDRFHKLENWRDQLIRNGDQAINQFITEYPTADRQQLRQLVRKAKQEMDKNAPPSAARKLFRYIRELSETN